MSSASAAAAHAGIGLLLNIARAQGLALSCDRFYFLRHGQTARNALRVFQDADEPLDATGERQAHEAAACLAGHAVQQVVASSMRRAAQTAGIVAQGQALPVRPSDGLRERWFGRWVGQSSLYIDWAATPPDGESLDGFVQRTADGLRAALAGPQATLVVAHGGTLYVLAGLLGIAPGTALLGNALPLRFDRTAAGWTATPLAQPQGLSFNLS